jgi:hypothetical protein
LASFYSNGKSGSINTGTISELVNMYNGLKQSGEIKKYNEESTKKDFILPLVEALCWTVYNKGNKASSVTAEETISKREVRVHGIAKN